MAAVGQARQPARSSGLARRPHDHRPDDWFWRVHDLSAIVERWQPRRGSLHVLTLPGPDAPGDELWRRFLRVVGAPPRRMRRVRRSNESLGYLEASLLMRVQSHLPRRAPRARVHAVLTGFLIPQVLAGRPNQMPIRLPAGERAWVDEETARRRQALARDDVALIGDLAGLDVRPQNFGTVSLEGQAPAVLAMTHDSLAALLAREDRQISLLQRAEAAPGTGGRVTAAVAGLRELADHVTSVARHRHYRAAAGNMLESADISATDPAAALDVGGELIAELVLGQAHRSRRIDESAGPGRHPLLRRVAALAGR